MGERRPLSMDLELEARKRRTLHFDPVVRCEVTWHPVPPPLAPRRAKR
jgi:hypothetical protein